MAGKLWRPLAPIGLAFRVQLWGHTEGVAASLGRALHPATAMAAVAPGANDLAAMALCQLLEQAPSVVPASRVLPLKCSVVAHALRSVLRSAVLDARAVLIPNAEYPRPACSVLMLVYLSRLVCR